MAESENGTLFDLHVVRRGHGDLSVTKHSLGGDQSETGVDLAPNSFRSVWSGVRETTLCARSQPISSTKSRWQR